MSWLQAASYVAKVDCRCLPSTRVDWPATLAALTSPAKFKKSITKAPTTPSTRRYDSDSFMRTPWFCGFTVIRNVLIRFYLCTEIITTLSLHFTGTWLDLQTVRNDPWRAPATRSMAHFSSLGGMLIATCCSAILQLTNSGPNSCYVAASSAASSFVSPSAAIGCHVPKKDAQMI